MVVCQSACNRSDHGCSVGDLELVGGGGGGGGCGGGGGECIHQTGEQAATLVGLGWVSVGLGGMLPVRTLKPCVTGFGLDTSGWTEPKAGWLDDECSRLGSIPWVSLRPCPVG